METYRKSQNGILLFMGGRKTLAIAFTLLGLVMAEASAGVLIFTHEGNGTGTLADNPFPASNFTITAAGDTDDRASHLSGWLIDHSSASISIDGVGEFEFLTGTKTFVNHISQIVGFSRASYSVPNPSDLFNGPSDVQFATWDMLGPIGPISGGGSLMQWTLLPLMDTTGGILKFDSSSSNATFTAVPEPATMTLLAIGGLVTMVKRKRKS